MRLLALWVVLASSLAGAEPVRALIWGGGATPEAATEARQALDASALGAMLTFAPGYPKVMESKDLKGLKAGFHIVLLGVCGAKEDSWLPLSVAKSVEPKVYVRGAESDGATSCPALKAPWKPASFTSVDALHVGAITDGKVLRFLALLSDAKWEAADFVTDEEECAMVCEAVTARADAKGGGVAWSNMSPGCSTPDEQQMEWRVALTKKRLSAKVVTGKHFAGQCD
jgi:hypothetical protein